MTGLRVLRARGPAAHPADLFALLKPRVMSLVVFTAYVGMVAAPGSGPVDALALLCIAAGAGAAGALNMWSDADLDALMRRTSRRPIPAGRVARGEALSLGLGLSVASVVGLWLAANALAAALLAATIAFYAVVYSMWLKRRTPQNIVIGGAAGAAPPMIGWAAATGGLGLEPALMFALILTWTPPHFWSLALFVRSDYGDAGVPMLTETHGARATRRHILGYALVLVPVALALGLTPVGGPIYLAVAAALNLWFVALAVRLVRRGGADAEADGFAEEKRLFRLSLWYLFGHFGALLLEALPPGAVGP